MRAIDISKHQGTFDPAVAKAAGIQSVILRAGYGNFQDVKFDKFAAACRAAGLPFGAYQFLTWHYKSKNNGDPAQARSIMQAHMRSLLEILDGSGATGWIALDQEMEQGQEMGLDPASNTDLLNAACKILQDAGYHPCVYTGASWAHSRILLDKLTCPVWVAYYYADPKDPDFDGCRALHKLSGRWGALLQDLDAAGQLCGWQFGRIGYGAKYGVASANVDKDWIYFQPGKEKDMEFKTIEKKLLEVTSAAKPACQAFGSPTTDSKVHKDLPLGKYPITGMGAPDHVAGMDGVWYKIDCDAAKDCSYVLALPDRCQVVDAPAPVEPPQPDVPDTPAEPVKPAPVPVILRPRLDLSGLAADLRRLADAIDGKAGA